MRASMIAFVKVFEPSAFFNVRETQDDALPRTFGHYLAKYGCTKQISWLLTEETDISSDRNVLNAKGDPGGQQKRKDPYKGLDSTYLQMAKSLGIPSDLRVCLRTDSTLTLFKTGRPRTYTSASRTARRWAVPSALPTDIPTHGRLRSGTA